MCRSANGTTCTVAAISPHYGTPLRDLQYLAPQGPEIPIEAPEVPNQMEPAWEPESVVPKSQACWELLTGDHPRIHPQRGWLEDGGALAQHPPHLPCVWVLHLQKASSWGWKSSGPQAGASGPDCDTEALGLRTLALVSEQAL